MPGKQLLLADMLSRASPTATGDTDGFNEDVEVHATRIVSELVSKKTMDRLIKETAADTELQAVINYLGGKGKLEGTLKPFASELSLVQGILFKGCKVVIPKSLRPEILDRIHEGHLGMNKSKAKARRLVFWPGLNVDIEKMLQRCAACRKYAYAQQSEPLVLRPAPQYAWYRVGVDIFQQGGSSYLCVFDALSNFPEVERLTDLTTISVIEKLSAIFARYGIPVEVCSDNGPQFSSYEFARFASRYDFQHVTSSPRFPQSNGLAEKGVQIVKRIMKKTAETKQDFWLGLLSYRSSPLEDGRSPGELLQGRRLRTRLPDFSHHSSVSVTKHKQPEARGRCLPALKKGEVVRVQDKAWTRKAQVLGRVAPRSYEVATEDGRRLRRNRRHLLRTREQYREQVESESSSSDEGDGPTEPERPRREHSEERQSPSNRSPMEQPPAHVPVPQQDLLPQLRRSGRQTRPPDRLRYDSNFNQIT